MGKARISLVLKEANLSWVYSIKVCGRETLCIHSSTSQIIIIIINHFMLDVYNYIPETNPVFRFL